MSRQSIGGFYTHSRWFDLDAQTASDSLLLAQSRCCLSRESRDAFRGRARCLSLRLPRAQRPKGFVT